MLSDNYLCLHYNWQHDVEAWLNSLKLGQYKQLFMSEGYCTNEDVENLKGLTSTELQSIGITRRGTYNQNFKLVSYFCVYSYKFQSYYI